MLKCKCGKIHETKGKLGFIYCNCGELSEYEYRPVKNKSDKEELN